MATASVTLQLELEVRSLTGQADNGVPVISNREYKGWSTLKDGEPTFIAGRDIAQRFHFDERYPGTRCHPGPEHGDGDQHQDKGR